MAHDKFDDLFGPSRLKIERAKKHVNDLSIAVSECLSVKPFELWTKIKRKPDEKLIFIKQNKPIPHDISLILGDAVHNLKSALDILAFGMVGNRAPKPARVLFPFAKKASDLPASIRDRQLDLAGEKVVDAILRLQPYDGGNKYLYGIQALDTHDKHHFIITTGQVASFSGDQLGHISGGRISGPGRIAALVPTGEAIIRMGLAGNRRERRSIRPVEMKESFQPTFEICFAPEQGFETLPVVESLLFMVEAAENALDKVGNAFFTASGS